MKPNKAWIGFLIVLVVIFLLRLPAFLTPILDVDESQFAGFADWLLARGTPYISSLDTKPLGIYYFYAAVFWLFGRNNMIAVHVVTALWVGLTAYFCYLIARDLHSRWAGFWAALFYAIFTTTYVPKFISTSIVLVMMMPLTASIYAAIVWERQKKLGYMWLSGLLWGIACLFKYQAGINLVVMGAYLLLVHPLITHSKAEIRFKELLSFFCGGALVAVLFALYLLRIGVWDEFAFWSIEGSFAYIGAGKKLAHFWTSLAMRGGAIAASGFLLWLLATMRSVRLVQIIKYESKNPGEYLILVWLLLSFIPVCTGGKFYGHYFIQLIPALCILASMSAANFLFAFKWSEAKAERRLLYALFIAGLIIPSAGFFAARVTADRIYAATGEENPKAYLPIAEYIKQNSTDEDMIFVWGFATPIYTFSDRLGASRFLWCDWLTGRSPGTPAAKDLEFDTSEFITEGSWKLFFEDMEKNKPLFFVDTSPGNHHDYGKYPINKFPQLTEWLNRHYRLETTINGADIYRRK